MNASFSILGGEPLKFCCLFVVASFNLLHEFSLVVGVEKSLLSFGKQSTLDLCEFSFVDCNGTLGKGSSLGRWSVTGTGFPWK